MTMRLRKQLKNRRGFTLVELLVVVAILGILAAIAIPRFSDATVQANTAKIATDLRTIDTAFEMYLLSNPSATTAPTLQKLVDDGFLAAVPAPPSGQAYIKGTATTISGTYTISASEGAALSTARAKLGSDTAENFTKTKPASGS